MGESRTAPGVIPTVVYAFTTDPARTAIRPAAVEDQGAEPAAISRK
jgi:hypothetical protein